MSKRFSKANTGDFFVVGHGTAAVPVWMTKAGCKVMTKRVHIRFDAGEVFRVCGTQPRKRFLWLEDESDRKVGISFDRAHEMGSIYQGRLTAEVARQAAKTREAPIACHNCGTVCGVLGEDLARRQGWEGFSDPINVIRCERTHRLERLGRCPVCIELANMQEPR